jgi:hypothetical protein
MSYNHSPAVSFDPPLNYRVIKPSLVVPNEHFPQGESVMAINMANAAISASRKQMYGNNLGQIVVVCGMTERIIQTGMDTLLSDTTFSQRMPAKGQIVGYFHRYERKIGENAFKTSPPQSVAIFRSFDDSVDYEYGLVSLSDYSAYHPYLGFSYVDKPGITQLRIGHTIEKDTVFRDSPGVLNDPEDTSGDHDYAFTVTINVAMMGLRDVAEDGIVIARGALKKFGFETFERHVVEFGQHMVPLNLYGDPNDPTDYKICPDIGEKIGKDGCLMALRTWRPDLAIAELSVNALRRIDYMFDKKVMADGEVIDIKVHHDRNTGLVGTPAAMETQPLKYDEGRREFLGKIYRWWTDIVKDLGRDPILQPQLHNLIIEAISVVNPNQDNNTVVKVHKKTRIDDYRMEFTIRHRIVPNMGNKFTDLFGGKGVVVSIWEDEDMPVDADGNRAEMIFDQAAVNNRMIPGRLYEHIINGSARDVYRKIVRALGIQDLRRPAQIRQDLMRIQAEQPELLSKAWEYLLGFYEITVPKQAAIFRNCDFGASPLQHLSYIMSKGHTVLYMRSDHPLMLKNMVSDIERLYPSTFGPVYYRGASGNHVWTEEPVRIAPLSIIMLEKIADTGSAVSSTRRQHAGVLATLSNADKYSERIRNQPTKAYGESEIRIVISYSGTLTAAEILDRNNSIESHKAMCWSIFESTHPTRIARAVDRNVIRLDGSRSLQTVNHVWACSGMEMAWDNYRPTHPAHHAMHNIHESVLKAA